MHEYLEKLEIVKFEGNFGVDICHDTAPTSSRRSSKQISNMGYRTFNRIISLIPQCTSLTYLCLEPPPGDSKLHWCSSHSGYLGILRILPPSIEVLCLRNWIVHSGMTSSSGQYGTHSRELRRARFTGQSAALLRDQFADRVAELARLPFLRELLLTLPLDTAVHPLLGLGYLDQDETAGANAVSPSHAWAQTWRDLMRSMTRLEKLCLDGLELPSGSGLAGLGPASPSPTALPWPRLRAVHLRCSAVCDGDNDYGVGASDETLLALAAACPGLEELRIDGAGPRVTDRALEGLCRGCPGLTLLSLLGAPGLRGGAAAAAALGGRRLRWLGLSGTGVSEAFLTALATQASRRQRAGLARSPRVRARCALARLRRPGWEMPGRARAATRAGSADKEGCKGSVRAGCRARLPGRRCCCWAARA